MSNYDNDADLAHLDEAMRALAMADTATRIRSIEKDLFIEHDYSRYLCAVLEDFMCGPRQTRMPCLLILGDAGMGKTAHIHRMQRQFPDHHDPDTGTLLRPVILANVPTEPTARSVEIALLEALDAPAVTHRIAVDRIGVIRRMLNAHRTRIVVFDEIQHICHTRSRERAVVLDAIKAVSTTAQVSVVCAGTPVVEREFLADPQLERRFEITRFQAWQSDLACIRFLNAYERARPLRLKSNLAQRSMINAILEETMGITHRIVQRLNAAAIVAIHEHIERITPELLHVQRTDPSRVLIARQAANVPSLTETQRWRTLAAAPRTPILRSTEH